MNNLEQNTQSSTLTLKYGDYVVYDPGYKKPEIGRVTTQSKSGDWFVCYHAGCTAACTPVSLLRKATQREIAAAPNDLGYHRFDPYCPEYNSKVCFNCIHSKE